ncbi:MAG TPA: L-rhamnose/proton symporter RhaT [Candidatus Limnocylindrales bacterium]|jgi:L-rhamnose-H+ transport protein|nr:L-rhamnose/proton symporter RhaT [Candidatus Limnocylindrales bacterium]
MTPNPFLGVLLHWLGGLAAGSFYVPYKRVKNWSWEVYWLVGGFFSWIIAPWVLALVLTSDLFSVLKQQSVSTLWWTYFFGALWGIGGLTFGLSMRYLGMSLGMGVALGYCAAFGTLVPPIAKSLFPSIPVLSGFGEIIRSAPGQITLGGVGVCLLGISIAAMAGLAKERELPTTEKQKAIEEFNFGKGMIVATFAGIMSSCMSFALAAGNPIGEASRNAGTTAIWSGLPKLVVVLLGGFTANFIWCLILNLRNGTGYEYFSTENRNAGISSGTDREGSVKTSQVPLLENYLFSALAGTTWYLQFFFYTMGETKMGKFGFASWTLHMASIIIFSTLWGWMLHEWKGSSKKAHGLIAAGIATLIGSTIIIGFGTWLKSRS